MPKKGQSKFGPLMADEDVRRWHENLARGSPATADNYLRVLGRFLDTNRLTAKAFLHLPSKRRDDLLADHVTRMLRDGRAGSYVEVTKKAVVA